MEVGGGRWEVGGVSSESSELCVMSWRCSYKWSESCGYRVKVRVS